MKKLQNPIVDVLNTTLIPEGFERKNKTWYRNNAETISIINLQKSQYGNKYYINLGICIKNNISDLWPKIEKSHVYGRIEDAVQSDKIQDILDLKQIQPSNFKQNLIKIIQNELLPWFGKMQTVKDVKLQQNAGKLKGFGVRKEITECE